MYRKTIVTLFLMLFLLFPVSTPGAGGDRGSGLFVVRCGFSHYRQADPIVSPNIFPSAHEHMFFGSDSTDEHSTYASMVRSSTSCEDNADTAGYWVPSLRNPKGENVTPYKLLVYYTNTPSGYSQTVPFPPDFRMLAGGLTSTTKVFWRCFSGGPSGSFSSPPACKGGDLNLILYFPNCWDGHNLDSADHRSHVVSHAGGCPSDHPIKLPYIHYSIHWKAPAGGSGWKLSDGNEIAHGDFWNTWNQSSLASLVSKCLVGGSDCGLVSG